MNHSFDRCLSKELEFLTQNESGEIFEIGCAPDNRSIVKSELKLL